jgi:hypothetical protein
VILVHLVDRFESSQGCMYGFYPNDFLQPALEVWDDRPGGTVVDRYTDNGVKYVVVEFKRDGSRYTFLAE